MFRIPSKKGFHITFKNGLTISVQFGYGNYYGNYNKHNQDVVECEDAEIAVFDSSGFWFTNEFIDCEGDDVKGRLRSEDVAKLIYDVSIYEVKNEKRTV